MKKFICILMVIFLIIIVIGCFEDDNSREVYYLITGAGNGTVDIEYTDWSKDYGRVILTKISLPWRMFVETDHSYFDHCLIVTNNTDDIIIAIVNYYSVEIYSDNTDSVCISFGESQ